MTKKAVFVLIVCALLATPTLASFTCLGWWDEGDPGSTHQYWDFTPGYVNKSELIPEDAINPGHVVGQIFFGKWDTQSTIQSTALIPVISLDLKIDNWVDTEPYKEIWVDLGLTNGTVYFWDGSGGTSVVASGPDSPYSYDTLQGPAPGDPQGYSFGFKIYPNPWYENIALVIVPETGGIASLDWVHVDTISIPAPGAILLSGIGVCLVGWLRRLRTL